MILSNKKYIWLFLLVGILPAVNCTGLKKAKEDSASSERTLLIQLLATSSLCGTSVISPAPVTGTITGQVGLGQTCFYTFTGNGSKTFTLTMTPNLYNSIPQGVLYLSSDGTNPSTSPISSCPSGGGTSSEAGWANCKPAAIGAPAAIPVTVTTSRVIGVSAGVGNSSFAHPFSLNVQ